MKFINTKELRQIQLSILNEIHKFCEENEINYVLAFGSLIGAIRHDGYIPWDDDIDIAMPRKDYEIFFKIFQSNRYAAMNYKNSKDYPYPYGKVYDSMTVMQENINIKQETGVYIDVFPVDGISNNIKEHKKQIKKMQYYRYVLNLKRHKARKDDILLLKFLKTIIYMALRPVVLFYSYKNLIGKIDFLSKKYKYEESSNVMILPTSMPNKLNDYVLQTDITKRLLHTFEEYYFYIPEGYDKWLTNLYGNYMQLPPESKREVHHEFVAYWKEDNSIKLNLSK
ncbi:phosphorylcholine transferase LicD [Bacteroidia bacterium]|nr:phosphorylcholine transferase LicD [Bacteroidia bacterium]